jgi:hypothetical protein
LRTVLRLFSEFLVHSWCIPGHSWCILIELFLRNNQEFWYQFLVARIPPGFLQDWRVLGMIISVGIGWEKIPGRSTRIPEGSYQE